MNEKKPYLVDAIIGNSSMLATLGKTGKMYRLWWPNIDTPQHIDAMRVGIQEQQEQVNWFDESDTGWQHTIAYEKGSNVLHVQAKHEDKQLLIEGAHFVVPGKPLLVREYTFNNQGSSSKSFTFVLHSSFVISENQLYNTTMFHTDADALIHFRKDYYFAVASTEICSGYQAGLSWEDVQGGKLNGNNIDMLPYGAMAWDIQLEAGQSLTIPIFVAAGHHQAEVITVLQEARSQKSDAWKAQTNQYWTQFLANTVPCPVEDEQIKELYERSILMFKLMSDEKTGTIIAAPEFDETFSRCGGYSFCWGRDAAFITTALDKVGLYDVADKFYDWTLRAQDDDGSWQQRHYHDGSLAPSWGLQIDEGASIIWGMWEHYTIKHDRAFAARVWPAVLKGAEFLVHFIDESTGLPKPSIDLWEEREASHTYSSAAVYGGLSAASKFAELAGEYELSEKWQEQADKIKQAIEQLCYNEQLQSYYRGLNLTVNAEKHAHAIDEGAEGYIMELVKGYKKYVLKHDPIIDVSLLGVSVPFGAADAHSKRMKSTADVIEQYLTSPKVKGIKRYEDDSYAGGNPWILTTLWLAHYRFTIGEIEEARAHMQWAIDHRTITGLLPEQIDKNDGSPAWVVPLTWSHAMFILAVFLLAEAEK